MRLFLLILFSSTAYASFCEDGSRREAEGIIIICGSAESPVRPEAETLSRHAVEGEFEFLIGTSRVKYHVNPKRLACENIHSSLYGTRSYWRCVRLVEYIIDKP